MTRPRAEGAKRRVTPRARVPAPLRGARGRADRAERLADAAKEEPGVEVELLRVDRPAEGVARAALAASVHTPLALHRSLAVAARRYDGAPAQIRVFGAVLHE